jgi:hypothetical protein
MRLIRTVAEGWEQKDVERVLPANTLDAVQRAWNEATRMIGVDGIRAEALGAFADPRLGPIRFEDWIHRIYIVNSSVLVEINQKFHEWGRDHYYRDFLDARSPRRSVVARPVRLRGPAAVRPPIAAVLALACWKGRRLCTTGQVRMGGLFGSGVTSPPFRPTCMPRARG